MRVEPTPERGLTRGADREWGAATSLDRCSHASLAAGGVARIPKELIDKVGLFGIWAIVFAESGLLIGFFLPGDSLLFTAGFFASGPSSIDEALHLPLAAR